MSAEKHTELPWKADKYIHEPKNLCIVNSKDEVIAIIPSGVPSAITLPDKENADYIVQACNAFPALVEALEAVTVLLLQTNKPLCEQEHTWANKAREALRLAKGE